MSPEQLAEENRREREYWIAISNDPEQLKSRNLTKEDCIRISITCKPDAELIPF